MIVVLEPGTNAATAAARARTLGATVERTFGTAVRAYAATLDPGQELALAADPNVVAIVPDERITGTDVLAAQSIPTGIRRVAASTSPAARIDGVDDRVDADVAIYDTGIDPTHPDLAVAGGYNCTSSNRADWIDEYGHGTHVAGTVGALDNGDGVVGVAPGARLWAVRILDANGEGYLSWWLCGLDWIAAQTDPADPSRPLIEVVNMSVTRWGRDDAACGTVNDDVLHQAICRVVAKGITVVAAAANDSGPASARVPAAYNEVITVSALADTDGRPGGLGGNLCYSWGGYDVDDTFADFSNYGSDVDLIAPGKCTWSTLRGNRYGYSSGTSMAAPHVAGAVALYKATRPQATPSEVRRALRYLANTSWTTSTDPDGVPDLLLDAAQIGPLGDFAPSATLPAEGLIANEIGASWSIPLTAGRGPGFIEPITVSLAAIPAPVTAALTGPTVLWDAAADSAVVVTVPPSTPAGRYEVIVRATYKSARVHDVVIPVIVENAPPVAAPPVASFIRGVRATLADVPVRLSWPAATDQSPIVRYDLGEAVPGTEPAPVGSTPVETRVATRVIPFATSRTYAVRALDAPGNLGTWASAAPVRVAVVREWASTVRRSSGWTRYASANALGGYAAMTTRAGATLRYTFTGRGIAVVGAVGPTRGRLQVRLDGVHVAYVSTYAAKPGSRWVLHAMAVDPTRSHTLEVRALTTSSRPRVDIDAFLVLR
jgi:subtilisin family serine protease